MTSLKSQKPITFFMPALFLLILGVGNLSVGLYKGSQYDKVLIELSSEKPSVKLLNNASPLRRIQYEKTTANRLDERQNKAKARQDLYRLVSFGGKFFIALGLMLFSLGLLSYATKKS